MSLRIGAVPASDIPRLNSPAALQGATGLSRDGNFLVLHLGHFQFPQCCIKTGRTDNLTQHTHEAVHVPNHVTWVVALGLLGALIGWLFCGQRHSITVPLARDWVADRERAVTKCVLTMVLGFLVFLGAIAAAIFFALNAWEPGQWAGMLCSLLGIATIIGGGVYQMRLGEIVKIHDVRKPYLWLTGVDPRLLALLPQFTPGAPVIPALQRSGK